MDKKLEQLIYISDYALNILSDSVELKNSKSEFGLSVEINKESTEHAVHITDDTLEICMPPKNIFNSEYYHGDFNVIQLIKFAGFVDKFNDYALDAYKDTHGSGIWYSGLKEVSPNAFICGIVWQ